MDETLLRYKVLRCSRFLRIRKNRMVIVLELKLPKAKEKKKL